MAPAPRGAGAIRAYGGRMPRHPSSSRAVDRVVDDVHRAGGVGDRAGERRVDGEDARDLVDRETALDGDRDGVDELGSAGSDDDAADDAAAPLAGDELDEAVLDPHHLRARVRGERELVHDALDEAVRDVLLLPAD